MIHGLAWLAVFILMVGSVLRVALRRPSYQDGTWGITWFLALIQLGYTARWLAGLAADHAPGVDAGTSAGLLIFSGLAAIGLVARRLSTEGWRW